LIHFSFSDPYGNTSSNAPRGAATGVSLEEGGWLLHPLARKTNKKRKYNSIRGKAEICALQETFAPRSSRIL
jgi:hypothetical protein